MSRLGDFFSETFARAKSHEPGWIQRLPSMPGSPQSLQDAFIENRWSHPYGKENTSFDIFAGGLGHPLGSEHTGARNVGRGVGTAFGLWGLGSLLGGSSTSAEGGGELGAGQTTTESKGLLGYLQKANQYRGLLNMAGNLAGGMGGSSAPADNSMIEPVKVADPYAESTSGTSSIQPLLMAMLMSQQGGQGNSSDSNDPMIGGRGIA